MIRKPFSTIAPFLPEGDDLISAQAIHYDFEFFYMVNHAAKEGLIDDNDPVLQADVISRDAPIGAARPRLAEEVHAHLKQIRQVGRSSSGKFSDILNDIEAEFMPDCEGLLAPPIAASLARNLERLMLLMPGPRDLVEQTAVLVARLNDTAVLSVRHGNFNGFCSDLAAISNRDDLRDIARGLTRDGTLPKEDPRVSLSDASLLREHDPSIAANFSAVIFATAKLQDQLAPCGIKEFSPPRLRRLISQAHRTMIKGFELDSQRGLNFLRILASTAEGLGMNLHYRGDPQHHALVDRLLSRSALLLMQSYPISHRLRCEAAGLPAR